MALSPITPVERILRHTNPNTIVKNTAEQKKAATKETPEETVKCLMALRDTAEHRQRGTF